MASMAKVHLFPLLFSLFLAFCDKTCLHLIPANLAMTNGTEFHGVKLDERDEVKEVGEEE